MLERTCSKPNSIGRLDDNVPIRIIGELGKNVVVRSDLGTPRHGWTNSAASLKGASTR